MKPRFPKKVTKEFLMVDLVNNLDSLAEEPDMVLSKLKDKLKSVDNTKLRKNLDAYGSAKAKRIMFPMLEQTKQLM
jgi:hypothetical protein